MMTTQSEVLVFVEPPVQLPSEGNAYSDENLYDELTQLSQYDSGISSGGEDSTDSGVESDWSSGDESVYDWMSDKTE